MTYTENAEAYEANREAGPRSGYYNGAELEGLKYAQLLDALAETEAKAEALRAALAELVAEEVADQEY